MYFDSRVACLCLISALCGGYLYTRVGTGNIDNARVLNFLGSSSFLQVVI